MARKKQRPKKGGLDVKVLRASFELLAPQGEALVKRFYDLLFERYPEVEPMFAGTTRAKQEKHLLAALQLVVANLDKPKALAKALTAMGARHEGYGALPAHYPAVTSTLLDTIKEFAGRKWTKKVATAWADALNAVAEIMIGGYESAEVATTTDREDKKMASRKSTKTASNKEIQALQAEVAELGAQIEGIEPTGRCRVDDDVSGADQA